MSDLRKVLRAINHSEEWREIVEAACMVQGVEYTREVEIGVTNALSPDIQIDPNTLVVDVSGVTDEAVLAEVAKYVPEQTEEVPDAETPVE